MIKKPKYPKKYRKITPRILKQIKLLSSEGWSHAEIALKFNVHRVTITRRLDPESRERALAGTRAWIKIRNEDPKYRAEVRESIRKNVNERYHNDKKYRKFLNDYSYFDKRVRRDAISRYNRMRYMQQKLTLLKRKNLSERKGHSTTPDKNRKNGAF